MCVAYSSDRDALSELFLPQASLDKQIKELNLRIVDLETKTLSLNSSRPSNVNRRLESRIEELQNQLSQSSKDSSRLKTADKGTREVAMQLQESERQRSRLEEEVKSYETRVHTMRQSMDEMVGNVLRVSDSQPDFFDFSAQQTSESNLQLAKRRVEREAADYKQKALKYETFYPRGPGLLSDFNFPFRFSSALQSPERGGTSTEPIGTSFLRDQLSSKTALRQLIR